MNYEDIRKKINDIIEENYPINYVMINKISKEIMTYCIVNKVTCISKQNESKTLQYTFINNNLERYPMFFDVKTIMRQYKLKKILKK